MLIICVYKHLFIRCDFNNIVQSVIQHFANHVRRFCVYITALVSFDDVDGADASHFAETLFLHISINLEFPKPFAANFDMLPSESTVLYNKSPAARQSLHRIQQTALPLMNRSVLKHCALLYHIICRRSIQNDDFSRKASIAAH